MAYGRRQRKKAFFLGLSGAAWCKEGHGGAGQSKAWPLPCSKQAALAALPTAHFPSAPCSALPAAGAIDSIKNRSRDASNALLGKEKTLMDEVGDMCPSMTFTQASATPAGCAAVSLPVSA